MTSTVTPDVKPAAISGEWSDGDALSIARSDFERAANYREQNHDRRFVISDQLYVAYREKKYWPNTRVPRSAMGIFMALSQIESLLPAFIDGLFSDPDFFTARPQPTSTMEQARAVVFLLRNQLRDLSAKNKHASLRELIRVMKKSDLVYGNGILEWGWTMYHDKTPRYQRRLIPKRMLLPNPLDPNILAPIPTGEFEVRVEQWMDERLISKPLVQNTDIRDFYIDPNCPSTNVQDASFCATRHYRSIRELAAMRDDEMFQQMGFVIPDDDILKELAKQKGARRGDNSKQMAESYRGVSWSPSVDQSTDPGLARIEVIRYWQDHRHVWFIPAYKDAPLLNKPNEYGMKPFLNGSYIDVLGRFYSLSICDLVEGDQKLAQDILNARLDELNLSIHPPIVRRLGARTASTMRKLQPGVEWEVDGDPSTDIVRMDMGQGNPQAFMEVNLTEQRVQRTTGVQDLSVVGVPSSGGNSANRTATGIATQRAASSTRIKYQVANHEDQVMVPLLNILLGLNKRYLDPTQLLQVLGPMAELLELDPLDILNADVQFEMLAATKMKMRDALAGGGLQVVVEGLANPSLVTQMAQQGKKLNVVELVNLVTDTFGIPHKSLYQDMTPEEMQALNQPSGDQMLRSEMQSQRLVAQGEHQESRDETDLLKSIMGMLQGLLTKKMEVESKKESESKKAKAKD